jgi:hypothetical protein
MDTGYTNSRPIGRLRATAANGDLRHTDRWSGSPRLNLRADSWVHDHAVADGRTEGSAEQWCGPVANSMPRRPRFPQRARRRRAAEQVASRGVRRREPPYSMAPRAGPSSPRVDLNGFGGAEGDRHGRGRHEVQRRQRHGRSSVGARFLGRIRRATEAARADLLSRGESRQAVILSLVSDVATAYLELRELDLDLEIFAGRGRGAGAADGGAPERVPAR